MVENCKVPGASPQTPIGLITAPPTALQDF